MIMFVLFIAKIQWTFLRGNQSAKPIPNTIHKRVIALIGRAKHLAMLVTYEGPFFFTEGLCTFLGSIFAILGSSQISGARCVQIHQCHIY